MSLAFHVGCTPPEPPFSPPPERTTVGIPTPRELRGVWVATVANIDFPSRPGLSAEAQQAELVGMLDLFRSLNLNAVFFQVRPEGDAFYASELEPWSRYLTGVQGGDPGYDPLETLVREAHARGIAVHAWFNPYRAKSAKKTAAVAPHVSVVAPDLTVPYGALLWMDPGQPAVRERTVAVVRDVVSRYDVDGVHFDDYFYPYPNGSPFPDGPTYAAYLDGGGTLAVDDWRRENVHALVRDVSAAIRETKPWVAFGVSPFGIYRPGQPEGIRGLDQYASIYADPLRWVDEGWVDYLAPQLYWPTTQKPQAHGPLMDWWAEAVADRTTLYIGNYLSQVGATPAWSVDELRTQHALARQHPNVGGNIWFSGRPLLEDRESVRAMFAELYPTTVLPPVHGTRDAPGPPRVAIDGSTVQLGHDDPLRSYVVYRSDDDGWTCSSILPADGDGLLDLGPGTWAVGAVDRRGAESEAVPFGVTGPR
ncbi:MAG: family 10 glycosylhydrolase [Alphaproteobacteria bacterium]|nr:family 10 glycosylhydrolase [Alphaproteobacteria bacterium]